MTDTRNQAPAASEPGASTPAQTPAAPATVVVEKQGWARPLVAALAIAGALVLGGAGGFGLAAATLHHGPTLERAEFTGGPGGGQQLGPQQGPGQSGAQGPGGSGQSGPQQGGPQQGGPGQGGPQGPGGQPPQDGQAPAPQDQDGSTDN